MIKIDHLQKLNPAKNFPLYGMCVHVHLCIGVILELSACQIRKYGGCRRLISCMEKTRDMSDKLAFTHVIRCNIALQYFFWIINSTALWYGTQMQCQSSLTAVPNTKTTSGSYKKKPQIYTLCRGSNFPGGACPQNPWMSHSFHPWSLSPLTFAGHSLPLKGTV